MVSIVTCHICGEDWDERDEQVVFTAGLWECYDEAACLGRAAAIAIAEKIPFRYQAGGSVSGGSA